MIPSACTIIRAVAKISSSQVYAFSRWETEQPGSSFGPIFLLFPTKIGGGHAHSSQGKSSTPGPQWEPWKKKDTVGWFIEHNPSWPTLHLIVLHSQLHNWILEIEMKRACHSLNRFQMGSVWNSPTCLQLQTKPINTDTEGANRTCPC